MVDSILASFLELDVLDRIDGVGPDSRDPSNSTPFKRDRCIFRAPNHFCQWFPYFKTVFHPSAVGTSFDRICSGEYID
jgi:hypothetical protein